MNLENEFKKIVIARLETLPQNRKISIGSAGEFTPSELIDKIKKGDSVGKKFVQIEMEFMQALKEGLIS